MRVKHVASIGILAGVVFSGGWIFYYAGHLLPIPGGKFLAMTPYLAFAMSLILDRVRTPWTLTMVGVAMGAIAAMFTPLMSLAVVTSGIAADLTARVVPGDAQMRLHRHVAAAAYPFWGFWAFTLISMYLTRNPAYELLRPTHLLAMALFVAVVSFVGAVLGSRFAFRIRSGQE
ncbi:MAG: hypothetical protein R6U92_02675 [Bacillota bacterium]